MKSKRILTRWCWARWSPLSYGPLIAIAGIAFFTANGCTSFRDGRSTLFGSPDPKKPDPDLLSDSSSSSDSSPFWDALSLDNVGKSFKKMTGRGPNQEYAKSRFDEADKKYQEAIAARDANRDSDHEAKFAEAAKLYAEAAERWPDSSLEHEALFRAGESYFFADNYPNAEEAFELLIKKYENTKYIDVVTQRRFLIAQYWNDYNRFKPHRFLACNFTDKTRPWLDTGGHSLRVWDRIRIDDPTGKLADDATMAAANSHFAAGEYIKADEMYSDLRKAFPSSEHQFNAHFLGLQAKLRAYQGAAYSGKPLADADKLITQIRKLFPNESQQEKEYLDRAYREIRYKQAEREWLRGQFYDQRAQYRAADMYYDTLVKDFSDTPFAERAAERMRTNAGKPPIPAQRLGWFVNLFPSKQDVKPLIKSDDITATKRR